MVLAPRWATPAVLAGILTFGTGAPAQTRLRVDPRTSLAWWQVNPHLNHLWATTCPEEPSWRPGEGRSSGWVIGEGLRPPKHGYAAVSDTSIVPVYPRKAVLPLCSEAVEGEVVVADTVRWQGVSGEVIVRAEALITGEERRDAYTRQAIFQIERYPEIRFFIDSIVNVTEQADTLRGTVVGRFNVHGVTKPMTAAVRAWHETRGLRVLAKFRVDAQDLTEQYGFSRFALGLGVVTRIWQDLFMGVDLVLRPQAMSGH